MYLERIDGPNDVKKLSLEQMDVLAQEMREALFRKLSKHGGHFGPNFGIVEATIALHTVFDSPKDKMVFDVSHQSYCHNDDIFGCRGGTLQRKTCSAERSSG